MTDEEIEKLIEKKVGEHLKDLSAMIMLLRTAFAKNTAAVASILGTDTEPTPPTRLQ